ncbi:MAG TPA: hypothetical protein VNG13_00610 [Mycobacteriales bacterium]|nr:hypothetical protein [Mycobacteriales bacterium]HVB42564.1 hypothetical protein [Streptosporangiaceae bacterium]
METGMLISYRRRLVAGVFGLLAAGVLTATAASAAVTDYVQAGVGTGLYGSVGHSVVPVVKFTGALTGGGLQVVVSCSAVAAGPAASVSISSCWAASAAGGSANAPSLALPGNAATTVGTNNVGIGKIRACETFYVQWLDGSAPVPGAACTTVSG